MRKRAKVQSLLLESREFPFFAESLSPSGTVLPVSVRFDYFLPFNIILFMSIKTISEF